MNVSHIITDLNTFHNNENTKNQNEKEKKVILNKDNQLREPELLHQSFVDS